MGRYVGSYQDFDGTRDIGSFWYLDLNARYTLVAAPKDSPELLKGAFIEVGGTNVLNQLPVASRYDFGFSGYDPAQADIRGRVLSVRLGGKI